MKTAIKVLVIIGTIIGISVSFFRISGPFLFYGLGEGLLGAVAQYYETTHPNFWIKSVFALVVIIIGLVVGIIASGKTAGNDKTIVMGVLLGGSGIIATILYSYVAGPIYILGGLLAIIAGLVQKRKLA